MARNVVRFDMQITENLDLKKLNPDVVQYSEQEHPEPDLHPLISEAWVILYGVIILSIAVVVFVWWKYPEML